MSQVDILRLYSRSRLWAKTSRDNIVALFLTSEIIRLGLEQDDRFPLSERDIAKALGVGRKSVNDAWRQLASERIVEFRQGIGVFIVNPDRVRPDASTLEVYFGIRKQAEIELARLAIEHATQDDFQAMREALDKQTRIVDELEQVGQMCPGSPVRNGLIWRFFLSDVGFHAAVRKTAKDPWLEIISEIAEARTQVMRHTSLSTPGRSHREILDCHKKIFEAIIAQREEDAREAVETHFEVALDWAKPVLRKGD